VLQFVRSAVFATIRTGQITENRDIRLLNVITKRLEPLRTRSWPASYIRAQRDASLIQGCTNELNTRNSDIQARLTYVVLILLSDSVTDGARSDYPPGRAKSSRSRRGETFARYSDAYFTCFLSSSTSHLLQSKHHRRRTDPFSSWPARL